MTVSGKTKRPTRSAAPEVLTPAQVEQITGLSKNTVYAALGSGALPGVRVGRRWLIGREALDRLLAGQARP